MLSTFIIQAMAIVACFATTLAVFKTLEAIRTIYYSKSFKLNQSDIKALTNK
jgi:hypothetical protein